jgi:hypothetical protein
MRRQKPGLTGARRRAGGGTVARTTATHSSSGSSPEISRESAPVTGAATPWANLRSQAGRVAGAQSVERTGVTATVLIFGPYWGKDHHAQQQPAA